MTEQELKALREFDTSEYDEDGFYKKDEQNAMCADSEIDHIAIPCEGIKCEDCPFETPESLKEYLKTNKIQGSKKIEP